MSGGGTRAARERLTIKKSDIGEMISHAKSCLPNESCGLIAGKREEGAKVVERVYKLKNTDESRIHFTVDQREQLASIKDMRARGLTPLGNFHSHPETPARPSEEDIKLAFDPDASYIIISLAGKEPIIRSFHIENGAAVQEDIITLE
ncbi:MAG: M67 family metallopeptidase [Synergistaceae bacterium]|jgi:proteasome lid subunit RPN8/RPN11|nr:M67 family metallopeptidase [Synergistaceae bacterium]